MTIKPKEKKILIKKTSHFDLLFKYAFSIPRFAKELFKLVLSKEEFLVFDWSTLRAEKDTFQGLRADAVFLAALKDNPKLRFRICLLLEHKSQYSHKIFSQMLQYQNWITSKSLEESGQAWPVVVVVVYNGREPWKWARSFQEGLWGSAFRAGSAGGAGSAPQIPLSLQKDMLDFGLRILDTHTEAAAQALKNKQFKSRGFLGALAKAWDLKADEGELRELISLFDNWTGDRGDSLILSLGDYLWSVVPGMTKALWDRLESSAVREGIFTKGGYMDIKEHIREEARQEGWQKGQQAGRQAIILNMLKEKANMDFICKVTGLSEEEINKLKNSSH